MNTGEGGTPAFLLSLRVKIGGNMIARKLLGGAVDAPDCSPLLFFKFSHAQMMCTHQNGKSDDVQSY